MGDDLVCLPYCAHRKPLHTKGQGQDHADIFLFLSSTGKLPSWVQYVILYLATTASKISSNKEEVTDQDSTL
jgi:hypothetical protein